MEFVFVCFSTFLGEFFAKSCDKPRKARADSDSPVTFYLISSTTFSSNVNIKNEPTENENTATYLTSQRFQTRKRQL